MDAVLLDLMLGDPASVAEAFDRLFAPNRTERVLRYLDARTTVREDAALVATLPFGPLLRAAASLPWRM